MTGRLQTLAILASRVTPGEVVVELGVNEGKSLLAMAGDVVEGVQLYGIDLWDMRLPDERLDKWRASRGFAASQAFLAFLAATKRAGLFDRVTWVKGDSAEIAKAWSRPIGLLHIDAAHDVASVRTDYERWSPWVVPGGWLAMDDADHPGKVGRVIRESVVPSGLWAPGEIIEGRLFVARRLADV